MNLRLLDFKQPSVSFPITALQVFHFWQMTGHGFRELWRTRRVEIDPDAITHISLRGKILSVEYTQRGKIVWLFLSESSPTAQELIKLKTTSVTSDTQVSKKVLWAALVKHPLRSPTVAYIAFLILALFILGQINYVPDFRTEACAEDCAKKLTYLAKFWVLSAISFVAGLTIPYLRLKLALKKIKTWSETRALQFEFRVLMVAFIAISLLFFSVFFEKNAFSRSLGAFERWKQNLPIIESERYP